MTALRKAGATVVSISDIGNGCPDLLVGFRGDNYLMEVKDGLEKLTADEAEFARSWEGESYVVRSVEAALKIIGAI